MTSTELRIDPADHFVWARAIARGVRADFGFRRGGAEELDLESAAYVTLLLLVDRFDESRLKPGDDLFGAFRGMASQWIRSECRREAKRLQRGGLARAGNAEVQIVPLPVEQCEDGSEVTLAAPEEEPEPDEPEPVACRHEPRLAVVNSAKAVGC